MFQAAQQPYSRPVIVATPAITTAAKSSFSMAGITDLLTTRQTVSYAVGREEFLATRMPFVVFVSGANCVYCREMERTTLRDFRGSRLWERVIFSEVGDDDPATRTLLIGSKPVPQTILFYRRGRDGRSMRLRAEGYITWPQLEEELKTTFEEKP